jgi:predicted lipoprotein with Yx(FWY)xxD motif
MKAFIWIAFIIAILGGGWYYYSSTLSTDSSAAGSDTMLTQLENQDAMQPGTESTIIGSNIALGTDGNDTLGTYLIGYTGKPVYTKDGDTESASTCYDACAEKWPPYLVGSGDNINQLKSGVTGKTGTIVRADDTVQMTYNGKPLYFYAADTSGSNALGDGVNGVWHVVRP